MNLKHQISINFEIMKNYIFPFLFALSLSCTDKKDFPEATPVNITNLPENALPGETILIEGTGFKTKETTVVIFPDNSLGKILEISSTYLKVVVPRKQDVSGVIQVRTGIDNYASVPFHILP